MGAVYQLDAESYCKFKSILEAMGENYKMKVTETNIQKEGEGFYNVYFN